jgi:hypothetical protein
LRRILTTLVLLAATVTVLALILQNVLKGCSQLL